MFYGVPFIEPPGAEKERRLKQKVSNNTPAPSSPVNNSTPNEVGRPAGANASYSRKGIQETIYAVEKLKSDLTSNLKKKINKKRLNKAQTSSVDQLVESIVVSSEKEQWTSVGQECISSFENIQQLNVMNDICEIAEEHELPEYPAAILYHSKTKK